jgi:hypothetical protein
MPMDTLVSEILGLLHDLSCKRIDYSHFSTYIKQLYLRYESIDSFINADLRSLMRCKLIFTVDAEVSPMECQVDETIEDLARWFFERYFEIFVLHKFPYVFLNMFFYDGNRFIDYCEGAIGKVIVDLVDLIENIGEDNLEINQKINMIYDNYYYEILKNADTIGGYICWEISNLMLGEWDLGLFDPVRIQRVKDPSYQPSADSMRMLRKWAARINGKQSFWLRAVYFREQFFVSILDDDTINR